MNVQTERLENHTARLTVEVDAPKWEAAKKNAARQLAKRYRIPGFRKGKAPYNIIARYVGEPAIVEDAMEQLGNEIYRDALDASDVNPYAVGSLEDFKLEPPTYIFTVPLQPEATLGDYRSIRMDYEAPEITDADVDEAIENLRQQRALVEESQAPAALGNRVTLDIHSEFIDGEEPEDEIEAEDAEDATEEADEAEDSVEDAEAEEAEEESSQNIPKKGDQFIHRHGLTIELREGENEPVLQGFSAQIVGANVGDTVEFELEIPDEESYEGVVGRHVHFSVGVEKIEVVTLPELNDDFAAAATEDEDEPLTLLQLRARARESLEEDATQRAESDYANKILDEIVEQAELSYPHMMVHERIDEMVEDFGRNVAQQGIQLDNYLQIMGMTRDDLAGRYHEQAEKSVERSIVLSEVLTAEKVRVTDADVEKQINEMLSQFGEQADALRQYLDTPQQRSAIASNLLYEKAMKRLAQIGQGLAPDLDALDEEASEESVESESTESEPAVVEASVEAAEDEATSEAEESAEAEAEDAEEVEETEESAEDADDTEDE